MDLNVLNLAYMCALFALPLILYKIALPSNHGREKRNKDWYYALKRLLCSEKITKFMNRPVNLPAAGPKHPVYETQEDILVFHGCDHEDNAIYLRVALGKNDRLPQFAEILMQLRMRDKVYSLPEGVTVYPLKRHEWRCKILTVTKLEKGNFRLVFNGFLREMTTNNVEHLSFNFLFTCASVPLTYPRFFDQGLFADAICREQWRDGNWTQKLGDTIGEEHFGTVHGTLTSNKFHVDTVWNLVGYQSRHFGTSDRYNVQRSISLLAVGDDGTVVHCQNSRIHNQEFGSCQVRHGAILFPNGNTFPVTGCDLPLPANQGTIDNMTVHIGSKFRHVKTCLHVLPKTLAKYSSSMEFGFDISNVMAEASFPGAGGKASFILFERKEQDSFNWPHVLLGSRTTPGPRSQLTIPLSEVGAQDLEMTGGKGQSLAILASLQDALKFKVPKGFVVTAKAMDEHFKSNDSLRRAICKLKMADSIAKVQEACTKIQDLLAQTTMPSAIEDAILESLKSFQGLPLMAVRSSGLTEDSESFSAAGQNESYLGCRTHTEILNSVKLCWASLYSFRSVEYRRQRGLDVESAMAVVVQEMIDSRIAGVLFTCDLDGDAGRMRITSNYGLGESIVSGEEGGDIVLVKRTWDDQLSIESMEAMPKKVKISLNKEHTGSGDSQGTRSVYLNDNCAKAMSICEEEVLDLAKVATKLERKYGKHLDIEWAYEEDHLVLLQARPVTFLENWTDYELEHEFDSPIICKQNVYTTANVKEVMPGAMTPLSNSAVCHLVDLSVGIDVKRTVDIKRREHLVSLRNHVFLSYYNVFMRLPPDQMDLGAQALDIAVCGHSVTTKAMIDRALHMHGRTSKLRKILHIWHMIKGCWVASAAVTRAQILAKEPLKVTDTMTLNDLLKTIDQHLDIFLEIITIHGVTSRTSSFYQMFAMSILAGEGDGTLTSEKYAQIALLFSNGSGVISAEIPSELEDIATSIRQSEKRQVFLDTAADKVAPWLKQHIPEAWTKYERFLTSHGHRSFREFEVMADSWATKPEILMKMLQTLSKLDSGTKKSAHLTVEQVIERMQSKMSKRFLQFMIAKCRTGVVNREKSKSEVVRHINTLRVGFRALGDRLQKLQYLPQKELVYFLTYGEVKSLISTRDPVLVAKAMRRSRLYATWDTYKFPEINNGMPIPSPKRKKVPTVGAAKLTGTPVCSGLVTARCCCIDSLDQVEELKQGDILITHGTDVGWTPYFPMLAGVVTELGGLISHGAVVAREYGLPCLIGVEGALDMFQTGDQVVLDTYEGQIYKES